MSSNLCFLEEAHGNNANRNTTHHFTPQAICTPGLYTVYIMALVQSLCNRTISVQKSTVMLPDTLSTGPVSCLCCIDRSEIVFSGAADGVVDRMRRVFLGGLQSRDCVDAGNADGGQGVKSAMDEMEENPYCHVILTLTQRLVVAWGLSCECWQMEMVFSGGLRTLEQPLWTHRNIWRSGYGLRTSDAGTRSPREHTHRESEEDFGEQGDKMALEITENERLLESITRSSHHHNIGSNRLSNCPRPVIESPT
ncbi:hypothetical protein F2P79_021105 [Pimephales promelas]|nr:hypothetical protein F2P79_021105 [Pimephales promelas]